MTKQLKLTTLFLLVASISFAQQNKAVFNTSKSNTKDRVAVDTLKKTEKVKYELPRGSFGGNKIIADSSKTPLKNNKQPRKVNTTPIP